MLAHSSVNSLWLDYRAPLVWTAIGGVSREQPMVSVEILSRVLVFPIRSLMRFLEDFRAPGPRVLVVLVHLVNENSQ